MRNWEFAERAAAIMETRGKCEWTQEDIYGRVCVVGAYLRIGIEDTSSSMTRQMLNAISAAERIITAEVGENDGILRPIVKWSDSHSQAEVVAGLKSAAAILRAQDNDAAVAQWTEQPVVNRQAEGSIPSGGVPERIEA